LKAGIAASAFSLLPLFAVTLVTAAVPGPGIFYVMRTGAARGRSAGIRAALGTTFASILMVSGTAIGAAQLFIAAPRLYETLRIAGGAYLVWFALSMWIAAGTSNGAPSTKSVRAPFWRATLIGLTNPKSILYFASILAPFFAPASPRELQAAAAALVVVTCLGWYGTVALIFSVRRFAEAYLRYSRLLDIVGGVLICACGAALLTNLW
jgi:threonine/homoserine/homoserine lactone efflux protein